MVGLFCFESLQPQQELEWKRGGKKLFFFPSASRIARSPWASRLLPTLRRYLSTISRPQLLHTHLPGGQTEPEAMDRGEDDGDSGAEEEHESSSPAPSGLTCRKPQGEVAGGSRSLLLSSHGFPGRPHRLPALSLAAAPLPAQFVRSHSSASPGVRSPSSRHHPPGLRPLTSRTRAPQTLPRAPGRRSSARGPAPTLSPPAPREPAGPGRGTGQPPPLLGRHPRAASPASARVPPHLPVPLPRRLSASSRPPGQRSARTLPT